MLDLEWSDDEEITAITEEEFLDQGPGDFGILRTLTRN